MTKDEAKKLVLTVRMALEALEDESCVAAIEARAEILKLVAQPVQPVQPADLQERFAALHLYEEIAEHYAKTEISPEALRDWVAERMDTPPLPVQEPSACCHACFKASGAILMTRMILCPSCGNKRCPKASDHRLECTDSNDSGQAGSVYAAPLPVQETTEDYECVTRQSAENAIEYMSSYNGRGREVDAEAMLVSAPLPVQPERQWVGLTDEEVRALWMWGEANISEEAHSVTAYEVEAKLKEKNNG